MAPLSSTDNIPSGNSSQRSSALSAVSSKLDDLNRSKSAVIEGNMHGEHGMRLRQFAMQNDRILGIRDLSTFAGSQLADKIQYDTPSATDASQDIYRLEGFGKDIHVKAKSSILSEIGGLIPAQNILSKKPAETPEERSKIDKYFQDHIADPGAEHSFIAPKKTVNGVEYDICFFSDSAKPNGVSFAYKDSKSEQYFLTPGDKGSIVNADALPDIQEVKVFADKKTGLPLIPDYDTAIHGSKKSSLDKISHSEFGFIRPEEKGVVEQLQVATHNMVRHGADTENPVGYKFEMTAETPYTMYTPDGKINSIDNEKGYVDFINTYREKGYDLVLNPKTGVELQDGKYILPPSDQRLDYEKMDKQINSIANPEQKSAARAISDKEIKLKQIEAAVPEAVHAMREEEAINQGDTAPTLEDTKKYLTQRREELRTELSTSMGSYKEKYGAPSPLEAALDKRQEVILAKAKAAETTLSQGQQSQETSINIQAQDSSFIPPKAPISVSTKVAGIRTTAASKPKSELLKPNSDKNLTLTSKNIPQQENPNITVKSMSNEQNPNRHKEGIDVRKMIASFEEQGARHNAPVARVNGHSQAEQKGGRF